tara:strand:+ start:462 stop:698 length:237 start_codon:yes stop_codon:yes gene_type:complete
MKDRPMSKRNQNKMDYYDGSEMLWSIADVQQQADDLDIYLGNEEARQILNATFKDNEYLMQIINEMITENIIKYNELH